VRIFAFDPPRKRLGEPGATRFTIPMDFYSVAEFLLDLRPFVLARWVHRVQGGTHSLARRGGCHLIAVVISQFTTEFGTLGV
jgi:hypothetical protein